MGEKKREREAASSTTAQQGLNLCHPLGIDFILMLLPQSHNIAATAPDSTHIFMVGKTKGKGVMPMKEYLFHDYPFYHAVVSFPEVPFSPADLLYISLATTGSHGHSLLLQDILGKIQI